ncbi:MAG: O-methyltransferase [Actinomycetota bacterium]|nr:O-methyltransferase [Actinomycetota bacterium]
MNPVEWNAVDSYLTGTLLVPDPTLDEVRKANAAGGLPAIDVAPNQGKMLMLFVRMIGATSVLEIGTLGAYSTIWLARGLATGGRVITLEADPHHAEVARGNLALAGVSDKVEIRLGAALDSLPALASEGHGPFDLVFIDADKVNNGRYLSWALRLTRPGSVIVADNVVRQGKIIAPDNRSEDVTGTRELLELLATDPRIDSTAIQTVGSKGWDGFALGLVTG